MYNKNNRGRESWGTAHVIIKCCSEETFSKLEHNMNRTSPWLHLLFHNVQVYEWVFYDPQNQMLYSNLKKKPQENILSSIALWILSYKMACAVERFCRNPNSVCNREMYDLLVPYFLYFQWLQRKFLLLKTRQI